MNIEKEEFRSELVSFIFTFLSPSQARENKTHRESRYTELQVLGSGEILLGKGAMIAWCCIGSVSFHWPLVSFLIHNHHASPSVKVRRERTHRESAAVLS